MLLPPMDLDLTLGCGQVFRWRKHGEWWSGVLGEGEIWLSQTPEGIEVRGEVENTLLLKYFRQEDDLPAIYQDIARDPLIAELVERYQGLRLICQDPWECCISYLLASNANFQRIQGMVESVCERFGTLLPGGRRAFPGPEEILEKRSQAEHCGLGYRCGWMVDMALDVMEGRLDLDGLRSMKYSECIEALKTCKGVGDKVADCIALFSLDHMEAFPVDVRIRRVMRERYGVSGSLKKVREFGQDHFGRYAGYAQEFLYLWEGERG